MVMSLSSAAFFAENFAGTVSVFVGAPGTAKSPLTNTAFTGGLAFGGGCFLAAGAARPSPAFCLASSEPCCCSTGLMLITTNSMGKGQNDHAKDENRPGVHDLLRPNAATY